MQKIIFSDVDGTLVDHSFTVTDEINNKLKNLEARFVVATGRMYDSAQHLNLGVDSDMICSNGSEVIVNDKVLIQKTMDKATSKAIVKELLAQNKYLNIYTTSGVYVPEFDGLLDIIMKETYTYAQAVSKTVAEFQVNLEGHLNLFYFTNIATDNIESVLATSDVIKLEIVDCHNQEEAITDLESNFEVSAYSSFGNNLEIVPQGITKVHGIKKYIEHINPSEHITFAIGDGNNDIEMLKHVDVAIAMGNACDALKQVADHVVSNQSDGGMLEALEIIENYQYPI